MTLSSRLNGWTSAPGVSLLRTCPNRRPEKPLVSNRLNPVAKKRGQARIFSPAYLTQEHGSWKIRASPHFSLTGADEQRL